ncbi:MAG: AzlD domain-containing protein [Burkholderiaceae bacterium]|nr:AzlD domain-containing protein [Burkholderiaceae bacterium]
MTDDLYVYAGILLLSLCSLITRAGYFLLGHHIPFPDRVRQALRFAPLAALTAIIVPEILPWNYPQTPEFDPKLIAAAVAIVVFQYRRNAVLLIASGMLTLWALQWIANG